eukprot:SAG11_NODE_571_length_8451_cov_34.938218_3_plen_350_part_00
MRAKLTELGAPPPPLPPPPGGEDEPRCDRAVGQPALKRAFERTLEGEGIDEVAGKYGGVCRGGHASARPRIGVVAPPEQAGAQAAVLLYENNDAAVRVYRRGPLGAGEESTYFEHRSPWFCAGVDVRPSRKEAARLGHAESEGAADAHAEYAGWDGKVRSEWVAAGDALEGEGGGGRGGGGDRGEGGGGGGGGGGVASQFQRAQWLAVRNSSSAARPLTQLLVERLGYNENGSFGARKSQEVSTNHSSASASDRISTECPGSMLHETRWCRLSMLVGTLSLDWSPTMPLPLLLPAMGCRLTAASCHRHCYLSTASCCCPPTLPLPLPLPMLCRPQGPLPLSLLVRTTTT